MKKKLSSADKIHVFTVFSASSLLLVSGFDAYLEHNSFTRQ